MILTDKNKAEIIQLLDIGVRELVFDFKLVNTNFSDKDYVVYTYYFNGKRNTSYSKDITLAMLSHPRRNHLIAQKINYMTKRDLSEEYKEIMDRVAFNDKLRESMPDKPIKEKKLKI